MGRKRAVPRSDVEYTFDFGQGKKYKFIYIGTNPANGRLRMFNVVTKTITTMLPERFSYIHRFNLVSECAAVAVPAQQTKKPTPPIQNPTQPREDLETLKAEEARIVRTLTNLSEKDRSRIERAIGKTPEKLLYDLQHAESDNEFGSYIMQYSDAMCAISGR